MKLGERLKALRADRGWSQRELARRAQRFPVALEKFWAVRAPRDSHDSGVSQLRIPLTS